MSGIPLYVTEWMKGYIGFGATDFDAGFVRGIETNTRFLHEMAIEIDDIDRFVSDPRHEARMNGSIQCDALGGTRPCQDATFNMLVDSKDPRIKYMLYRMPFTDGGGNPRTLLGHKTVHDDRSLDLWSDTTTLHVRIFEGTLKGPDEPSAEPIARGIIHIEKLNLIRSVRSFRSPGSSPLDSKRAMATFSQFFFGRLWDTYGRFGKLEGQVAAP